jgi:serine/threonine protein kinase
VYAFGVILFRMLTGRLPFEAEGSLALVAQHVREPPPRLAELRPDAPARLAELATAALSKDPRDRPPDGASLVAALGAGRPAVPLPDAAPTQVLTQRLRALSRRRLATGAAALALLPLGLLAALVAARTTSPDQAPAGTDPDRASGTAPTRPEATTETRAATDTRETRSTESTATTTSRPESSAATGTTATVPPEVTIPPTTLLPPTTSPLLPPPPPPPPPPSPPPPPPPMLP